MDQRTISDCCEVPHTEFVQYIGLTGANSEISCWSPILLRTTGSTIAQLHRLGVMRTLLNSLFLTALLAGCHGGSQPNVQLGGTTLIGKLLQASNVEFFGGFCSLILSR